MPVYDFICKDCHATFENVLTLPEYDKQQPVCPKCGGKNVEQAVVPFYAVTSRKS